jgi:hypothetical protein
VTYGLTPEDKPKAMHVVADSPRIADDVACANCGESLRGVAYSGACPRCATPVSDMDRIRADKQRRDPECPSCGYNLRGLPANGRCPECGLEIAPEARLDLPLCIMPPSLIGRFWIGTWLATACVVVGAATFLWLRAGPAGRTYVATVQVAVSLVFVAAVWILTPALNRREGIARGFYQRSVLRRLSRWLALSWPAAASISLLTLLFSSNPWFPHRTADWALALTSLAAVAGVVCLAILLENLSNWTCDEWAEKCFNLTAFGLPASWLLLQVRWPLPFVAVLLGVLCLASLISFIMGLISLSGSVAMSVFHHHEHLRRLERRREREQKHERSMAGRFRRMDEAQARRQTGARSA